MIKRKQRGVSIVEVVVSMVILMLALSAMAFVYPQGRKITDKSDKRTKATEIARSILEETQGLKFEAGTGAVTPPNISDVGLIGTSSSALNRLISGDNAISFCTTRQWPYHHYSSSTSTEWMKKIPVFISNAENSTTLTSEFTSASNGELYGYTGSVKSFALLTKGIDKYKFANTESSIPRFIIVSPDNLDLVNANVSSGIMQNGAMVTLQSCVVWMDYIANQPHLDCVILLSGVSSNRYTGGVEN